MAAWIYEVGEEGIDLELRSTPWSRCSRGGCRAMAIPFDSLRRTNKEPGGRPGSLFGGRGGNRTLNP